MSWLLKPKTFLAILVVVVVAAFPILASAAGLSLDSLDAQDLQVWFASLGIWGPIGVIGAMTVAILVSPIPSAPIALSAGAVYGHTWGTLYVLIGSEAGAVLAFLVARYLGHETLHRRFGTALNQGLVGSQSALMWTVFVSRLLPFISFDIVSYAAGLSALQFWRFALATLAGIVPASFLLAHFGSELTTGESAQMTIAVLAIGVLVAAPILWRLTRMGDQD